MKPKVLVVDDQESIRRTLSAVLKDDGYPVILASSGEQALERAAQDEPQVVLLDIAMPGMDGIDVLSRLLPDGKRQIIGFRTAGDFLGYEIDRHYTSDAEAVCDGETI